MTASRIIEIDLGSRRGLRRIHRVSETESFSSRTGSLDGIVHRTYAATPPAWDGRSLRNNT